MDRGEGVRRRHRHHEPPSRPRVDPAGHLLRLAAARSEGRHSRRAVFHRPGTRADSRAVGGLFGGPSARLDPRGGGRRRSGRSCGRAQRGMGTGPCELEEDGDRSRAKDPLDRLRVGGRRHRGHGRSLPGARARRLRGVRDPDPPAGPTLVIRVGPGVHPRRRSPRGGRRWSRGAGLGGIQGRRSFLWRRVRHHPAHAARRRHHLPLDEQAHSSSMPLRLVRSPRVQSCRPSPWSATPLVESGAGCWRR